jgi:hypothetical protein
MLKTKFILILFFLIIICESRWNFLTYYKKGVRCQTENTIKQSGGNVGLCNPPLLCRCYAPRGNICDSSEGSICVRTPQILTEKPYFFQGRYEGKNCNETSLRGFDSISLGHCIKQERDRDYEIHSCNTTHTTISIYSDYNCRGLVKKIYIKNEECVFDEDRQRYISRKCFQ